MIDKNKKIEDEGGALAYKIKQTEKKHKQELENYKKQKEDMCKKMELLEKSKKISGGAGAFNKSTSLGGIKSRNMTTTMGGVNN
ncbi:MAG: hypothetical protein ACMG6E_04350 [Candidatus Roizmanbacteria bacterium]